MVHFYFTLPVALWAVAGVARRLTTILTFLSRRLSNQNVHQGRVNWILTFFRSTTFRAQRRRHMKSSFAPQFGGDLQITICKNGRPKEEGFRLVLCEIGPERLSLSFARCKRGMQAETGERFTQILDESFGVINVSIDSGAASWSNGFDFVKLEFASDLFDNFRLDRALLLDKAVH